jgi:hypothetical protein
MTRGLLWLSIKISLDMLALTIRSYNNVGMHPFAVKKNGLVEIKVDSNDIGIQTYVYLEAADLA